MNTLQRHAGRNTRSLIYHWGHTGDTSRKRGEKNGELRLKNLGILETDIELLENEIDSMENELPEMTHFVLPGGHTTVSHCHIARCVCRRAERLAVHLSHNEPVAEIAIKSEPPL
jgi:cob(I)alamin adenosyltransferase